MNNRERLIKLIADSDDGEKWPPDAYSDAADAIIKDGWIPIGDTEIDIGYAAVFPFQMGDESGEHEVVQRDDKRGAEQTVAFANGRAVSHGFKPLAKVQRRLVIRGPWGDVE